MLVILNTLISSCNKSDSTINTNSILATNDMIRYEGRVWISDDGEHVELIWPASSVNLSFKSTKIEFSLINEDPRNVFNIYLDGKLHDRIIPTVSNSKFEISDLSADWHTIKIVKCGEVSYGTSKFVGFELDLNSEIRKTEAPEIKLEFYGDSITTGRELEDLVENNNKVSNVCESYAYICADHYNTQISVIAESGMGIVNGFIENTIFDTYDIWNPTNSSKWNFSNYVPDVVVINLLQNDHSLIDKNDEKDLTAESIYFVQYFDLLERIRILYPEAHIVSMLGNMTITKEGSVWIDILEELILESSDPKLHFLSVPFKNSPGHPTKEEQSQLASALISFLELNQIL